MPKPTPEHPILTTPRLTLRQFREDDATQMHACFSNPEIMRFWSTPLHTSLIESERAVRNRIKCTPAYYRHWAVAETATDLCLGAVSYHDGHIRSRRAEIGYMIHPDHHRKGLATEAVSALVAYCFGPLKLHRLQAYLDPENTASRALVEKLGFKLEGHLRDNLFNHGKWHDNLLYARLATDRV